MKNAQTTRQLGASSVTRTHVAPRPLSPAGRGTVPHRMGGARESFCEEEN